MRYLVSSVGVLLVLAACNGEPTPVTPPPPPSTVDTGTPPPVDTGVALTCATPDGDIGSALGQSVQTGDTCDAGHDYPATCGQYQGNPSYGEDLGYTFTATVAGEYTFDTVGSEADTLLTVRATCADGGAELACNDDIDYDGDNFQSSITLTLTAGQQVVVVVDSFSANFCGPFQINIAGPGGEDTGASVN